jgi:hypothetical protein
MAASASGGVPSRNPSVAVSKLLPHKVKFTLSGTDISVANALRRVMMAEVPCFAVQDVIILENTSVLHDEFVAHRLGLIPIRWKAREGRLVQDQFPFKDECDCDTSVSDTCPKCTIRFELRVENNNDVDGDAIAVTSRDLRITYPPEAAEYFEVGHFIDAEEQVGPPAVQKELGAASGRMGACRQGRQTRRRRCHIASVGMRNARS